MSRAISAIGLGSNLGDPAAQLRAALAQLRTLEATELLAVSGFYRSAPQGDAAQPDYVNTCALVRTALSPLALLDALQGIEQAQGKVRRGHWQAREIDLDLLVHGDAMIQSERLTLPHPWLHRRDFVLVPLAEIAPDLVVPGRGRVRALLENLSERFILERL